MYSAFLFVTLYKHDIFSQRKIQKNFTAAKLPK